MSADGPAGADGVPPVDWARIDPAARPDTQRVVVTGMGMVSSLGPDVETTFERAARAESGIRRLTRFDPTGLPCDIGGEIDHDALDPDEPEDAVGGSAWHLLRTAALPTASRDALAALTPAGHILAENQRIRVFEQQIVQRLVDLDGQMLGCLILR